jgi:hypothetical protein
MCLATTACAAFSLCSHSLWTQKPCAYRIAPPSQARPPTQDVAKVDVEEAAIWAQHEVVQVAVPHAQDVGHHAVAGAGAHKGLEALGAQAKGAAGVGLELCEEPARRG